MPFPESPRVLFQQNPLVEVICQLRFPPILSIGSGDPADFQDEIRTRYPLYERAEEIRVPAEVENVLKNLPVQLSAGVNHKFATADNKQTLSLTRDFLAFADQAYRRWEDFYDNLEHAIDALERIYHPAFYSRVGLRYRDEIDRKRLNLEDKPWRDLLQPWLLNVLAEEEVSSEVVSTQSKTTIRVSEAGDGAFVTLRYGFSQDDKEVQDVYSIDADFFATGRIEREGVGQVLASFNKRAGDLFRWCLKDELREVLQPCSID